MILLRNQSSAKPTVGVVGQGLIGSAIVRQLEKTSLTREQTQKLDWSDLSALKRQFDHIENELVRELCGSAETFDLIWSAGKAGFSATSAATLHERKAFATFIGMVEYVVHRCSELNVGVHLLSSGGGLYEGQQRVDYKSVPIPHRPYGDLKLQQERMLTDSRVRLRRYIYRPSSVFGWLRGEERHGLVQTMVYNGLMHRETIINGDMHTLRDYIWVEDVAREIVAQVGSCGFLQKPAIHILANGCPCSIFQIKHMVESIVHRPLMLRYSRRKNNASDTTFAAKVLKNSRPPTDMRVAIGRMVREFASNGLVLQQSRT